MAVGLSLRCVGSSQGTATTACVDFPGQGVRGPFARSCGIVALCQTTQSHNWSQASIQLSARLLTFDDP